MRARAAWAAALAIAAAVILSGCSNEEETRVGDTTAVRPAMEEILSEYEALQQDIFEALRAEFGAKPWGPAPNDTMGATRSGCEEGGETVNLTVQMFEGTYEPAEWNSAVEIVRQVGTEHGFTETATLVQTVDDTEVVGADEWGGTYRFGMAVNTILSMTTGCHEWAGEPGALP